MEAVSQTPAVRRVLDHPGMTQNFISCDRDQQLLMPQNLREWLPDGHLAWFVLDAVRAMDLSAFYEPCQPVSLRYDFPRAVPDRCSSPAVAKRMIASSTFSRGTLGWSCHQSVKARTAVTSSSV